MKKYLFIIFIALLSIVGGISVSAAEKPPSVSDKSNISQGNPPVLDQKSLREDKALAAIAARSKKILQRIKSLSEGKELASTARTFANVDKFIEGLELDRRRAIADRERQRRAEEEAVVRQKKSEEEAALRQKHKEDEKLKRQAVKAAMVPVKPVAPVVKAVVPAVRPCPVPTDKVAEDLYQKALKFWREKNYSASSECFLKLETASHDFKDTRVYLAKLERIKDDEQVRIEEARDREAVQVLARKATTVNVEILDLTRRREYAAVEARFNDLETILKDIQAVKTRVEDRRTQYVSRWEKKVSGRKTRKGSHSQDPAAVEKSGAIFAAAQKSYESQDYVQARTQFIDAALMDPSCENAAKSYIVRIDRFLAKRDFEAQRLQKQINAESAIALEAPQVRLPVVIRRANNVAEEGKSLYSARRYREAGIKFEELAEIGSPAQKRSARKYMALVADALAKDRKVSEAERNALENRYLKERSIRARSIAEQDRQSQELAVRQAKQVSEAKVRKAVKAPVVVGQKTVEQKRLMDKRALALESSYLRKQAKYLRQTDEEADKKKLQALQKLLEERKVEKDAKAVADQLQEQRSRDQRDREQQDMLRRNRMTVQSILREFPDPKKDFSLTETDLPGGAATEDTSDVMVTQAVARQKRQLEEQRAAVRKEFEEGVDRFYNDAITLYNKKMYQEAIEDFRQVDALIKGYKKTAYYLEAARKAQTKAWQAKGVETPAEDGRLKDIKVTLDVYDRNAVR